SPRHFLSQVLQRHHTRSTKPPSRSPPRTARPARRHSSHWQAASHTSGPSSKTPSTAEQSALLTEASAASFKGNHDVIFGRDDTGRLRQDSPGTSRACLDIAPWILLQRPPRPRSCRRGTGVLPH
ncbi:hypothetical protein BU16DRAFT_498427, partial [Lophium mytilinum]